MLAVDSWPFRHARMRAVSPLSLLAFTHASFSTSIRAVSSSPRSAARMSGVNRHLCVAWT
eukprot:2363941-Rhodomonas_salina.1